MSNLYRILESQFPKATGACAFETADGRYYTFDDLRAGSAKLANWLASLNIPRGSRIAVQVPGNAARGVGLSSAEHGLPRVGDHLLFERCRTGCGGLQPRQHALGGADRPGRRMSPCHDLGRGGRRHAD